MRARAYDEPKDCPICGVPMERRRFTSGALEKPAAYRARQTCSKRCGYEFTARMRLARGNLSVPHERCTCLDDHRALIVARSNFSAKSDCWVWDGNISAGGYGRVRHAGRRWAAHRISYEAFVGPIAQGLVIDHLCRNRACVNPQHLDAVTNRENILRGQNRAAQQARATHCKRGHELPTKTETGGGKRNCRECVKSKAQVPA